MLHKMGYLPFLIVMGLNCVFCDETTTESTETTPYPDYVCPLGFVNFNSTCYQINDDCPYHLPLPFAAYLPIVENTPHQYVIDAEKKTQYDYYQWIEPLGNYETSFTDNFTNSADATFVIANFTTSTATYFTTSNSSNFSRVCAYNSFADESNSTYCHLFDKICTNNTHRDSYNCHCRNTTQKYFCELKCDNSTEFNETVCEACAEISEAYKQPSISLSFDYHRKVIYVSVESYLKLAPVDVAGNVSVHCYTDARSTLHDIMYKYKSDEIQTYNTSNYKTVHYSIQPKEAIGHYWCEGFEYNADMTLKKSGLIIAEKNSGESFTMNITVVDTNRSYPLTLHEKTLEFINQIITDNDLPISVVRFLRLYERDEVDNTTTLGYRLYFNQSEMLDMLDATSQAFENVTLAPSYCLPDTTYFNNVTLTWKKTLLGMTVIPQELCLNNDSTPVTRKCVGEYLYGVYWEDVKGSCVNNSGELFGSNSTTTLHNLTHTKDSNNHIPNLRKLISENQDYITVDAHFMAQIFENVTLSNASVDLSDLIGLASDIMDVNRTVLNDAQLLLNSTDMILYNLDMILSTYNYTDTKVFTNITKNVFVQVSTFNSTNVTGAAVYDNGGVVTMKPLKIDQNLDDLDTEGLKVVAFLTGTQLTQVTAANGSDARLVITVFREDSLFNDRGFPSTTGYLVGVHVTSFEIPFLYDYVRVIITPDRKYRATLFCNFWDYGRDRLWINTHGKWVREFKAKPFKDSYSCDEWALHKMAIVTGSEADVALSIVAAVGCALSMFGSMAVIITGLIYKNWRENSGTKVLLNFVLTNFVQNIILAASSGVDSYKQTALCIVTGACLHYSVVSQFTWMVIIGYLQYERYVQVFYTVSTRFVLMSSILAWMVPTIPVVAVLAIDDFQRSAYVQDNYCYLHERKLIYGIYLPVGLTLTSNTIIFVIILINIYCQRRSTISVRDNMSWLNLRLVILLFFLLGFYWLFGIAARLTNLAAFDYFFCISAGMQGIVIFLYFIVFNKMTRNFWLKQLRRSEMITAMQIWLQQRKKIGRVKIDKGRTKSVKVRLIKTLKNDSKIA